jgi:protocadherin Fat 4
MSVLTVSAYDKDTGVGQKHAISYSIASGNDGNAFTIDASTGALTVNSSLDSETVKTYTLILDASELGSSQSPVSVIATIMVLDVNDNPPAFDSKNYSANLPENAQIHTIILQITAEDKDITLANKRTEYAFNPPTDSKRPFSINSKTGSITLNSQLDYESGVTSYTFQVTATNLATPTLSDSATVVVNITDVNDNNPVFHKTVFAGSQDEGTAPSFIVKALASDVDSGSLGQITYSIVSGNDGDSFEINGTTADISNKKVLDRETQESYTLTIQAEDAGKNSRHARAVVNIAVNDINDNPPVFSSHAVTATLAENNQAGAQVAVFTATDADIGTNSALTFKILAGNSLGAFQIADSTKGIVTAKISLDYELIQSYSLTIEVRDDGPSGGLSDNATLTVNVENQNDNSPVFASSSYTFNVSENQINSVLGNVLATDADGDSVSFGKVTYSLAGVYSSRFNIGSSSGQITTAVSIDREDAYGDVYSLLAIAQDNAAAHRRGTTAAVTIHILDENDNSPTFSPASYSASITEESLHPDFVTVTATDPDKGSNGIVTYAITGGDTDSLFSIDATSGRISATSKPDRETLGDSYTLTVTASDGAALSPRTDTATVTVSIRDVNDNDPIFDLLIYRATISENDPIGDEVVRVRATEKDVGLSATITYAITASIPSTTKFSIDTGTGSVTTKGTIDYERDPHSYTLTVTATDGLGRQGNCSVVITITDYNDNSPVFTKAVYKTSIPENLATTTFVTSVSATDGDTGSIINRQVVYSIIAGADGSFSIDSTTGNISVLTSPDYETKKLYTLDVQAQDQANPISSRLVGVAKVEVTITDVNDNSPVFVGSYAFKVVESATVTELVGVVSASDADDPNVDGNGLVTYSLTGTDAGHFAMEKTKGYISVAKLLDYETKSSYDLTVVATDGGGRKSSTSVNITVIDINDNPPEFTQTSYSTSVDENVPLSFPVLQVSASEKDTTRVITYSLSGGDGRFKIVSTTGQVLTSNSIDFETAKQYSFHVTAQDDGIPPRQSSVLVTVNVRDLNDNYPLFTQTVYSAIVKEELPSGQNIVTVSATDIDSSSNGDVSYVILDGVGKDHFSIDSSTGYVTTTTSLDRETQDSYILTLQARDGGSPFKSTNATLNVTVQDVNDNTPYFDPATYAKVTLIEDTAIGSAVVTVTAKDSDIGVNKKVIYSLRGDDGRFQVNRTTGEITTLTSLNRETKINYILRVTASDSGLNPRSSTVNVAVTVTDVNDNPPAFVKSSYSGVIMEGATNGTSITAVSATDRDDGNNGAIDYTIVNGDVDGAFRVTADGEIQTTSVPLDRETKSSYTLTIQATDRGIPQKSATVLLQITVTDANDNNPTFSAKTYASTVSEEAVIGTTVLTVTATDLDTGLNAAVTYSFANPSSVNATTFSIGSSTGYITTAKTLNAEKVKEYTFVVTVTDQGAVSLSSDATVVIRVRDVNDNDPVFNQTRYRANVYENKPSGTSVITVLATEKDAGDNGKITYSITFGDTNGKFRVDSNSGLITTTGSLDRETVSLYTLTVTATDNGTTPRSGQSTVEVSVLDRNDQSPKFTFNLYTKTVSEGAGVIGTVVATVSASDADLGKNKEIRYSITGGNGDGIFSIADPSVGEVTTVKALDREATPNSPAYTLTITATDQGPGSLNGTTKLQVTVSDINDNSPQFVKAPYSATIAESLSGGSSVVHISATDNDTSTNAVIVYKLVTGTPDTGLTQFELDSDSGLLRTKPVSLDYETVKSYTFEVTASDKGSPSLTAKTTISLTITDVNDNDPIFAGLPYSKTLAEGASSDGVTIVMATAGDADSGLYGTVRYSISAGNSEGHFAIDSFTGVVTTTQSLDFETTSSYTLTVTAQDQNGTGDPLTRRSASTTVPVTVTDINDNAPVFDPVSYKVSVSESSLIGLEVVTLTATDEDSGNNAEIVYNIIKGNTNGDFTIDPVKGKISVAKSLDIERTIRYDLEVSVKDKGTPSLNATATIQIDIADVNDNAPVFERNQYSVDFNEGVYAGTTADTFVVTVSASDLDRGTNGVVRYNVTSGDTAKLFTVDATSGRITVTGTLDREAVSSYDLTIEAADQGVVKLTGTTHVLIRLLDINDNAPQFVETSYTGSITENAQPGKTVTLPIKIKATDRDIGNNRVVSYSLTGTSNGNFSINATTAVITTSDDADLDREAVNSYSLTIIVTDSGGLSSSVPLKLTVTDENDNSPVFSPNIYKPNILENATVGFSVTTVTATDSDIGPNKQIHFGIVSGSGGKFRVDPNTGVVTVDDVLSRELQEQYVLNISATDGGAVRRVGFASVTITLVDINDNPPVFEKLSYTVNVLENATVGSFVVGVNATDVDDGVNGELTYDILAGDTAIFAIHRDFGTVTLLRSLDRESTSTYTLTIRCSDDGAPKRSAKTVVKVVVLDVNDNSPVFSMPSYSTSILETVSNGSILLVVAATDADLGVNGRIEYSLLQNSSLFSIDNPTLGLITLKGHLDREASDKISFTVIARDLGDPQMSALTTVTLNILDLNDNNPIFSQTSYQGQVKENLPSGVSLLTVNATEKDVNIISYFITGGNEAGLFKMDSKTGLVSTNASLNREKTALHILSVTALDDHSNPRHALTSVVINVLDQNDNPPVFLFPSYDATLLEDAHVGTVLSIISLVATDGDINENAQLSYFLEADGNINDTFSINIKTAVISTTAKLDREKLSSYKLTVTVTDGGTPQLSNNATVSITVLDVNDHTPVFLKSSYSSNFSEDVFGGHPVAIVEATDEDIDNNAEITYHIIDGAEGKFIIAPSSGVVTTTAEFDYELKKVYKLTVMALDGGTYPKQRNSTVPLTVNILDVNDNSPIFSAMSYSATLSENTTTDSSVVNLSATDDDSGINAVLRFNLTSGDPYEQFSLDANTGRIYLVRSLDYENTTSYQLTVEVYDEGVPSRTTSTQVDVTVVDSNDNPPVFSPSSYSLVISEATTNMSVVAVVSATDQDEGTNADILFRITAGNVGGRFAVNERSGEVYTVAPLDRETLDYYLLTVTATDSPVFPNSVNTTISINISDYNDNSPIFSPVDAFITIPENFKVNSFLISLNASDIDLGNNALISYAITSGGEGLFEIHRTNATVMTTGTFDRETKDSYQLFVQAQDHGTTQTNTGYGTLTVAISDVNDNSPNFEQSLYSGVVKENQPNGTSILTVTAHDKDIGSNRFVSYSLITNGAPFEINNATGLIYTISELDFEMQPNFTFTVVATNSLADPPLSNSAQVFVSIEDINDNNPSFSKPVYRVSVSELFPQNAVVITVSASDMDVGDSGELSFTITDGDPNNQFKFRSQEKGEKGKIVIATSLDREAVPSYNLTISVNDDRKPKLTGTAKILITVLDENDNAPVFMQPSYTTSQSENVKIGTAIVLVSATDDDRGSNKQITYSIVDGNGEGKFGIEADSGNIFLGLSLDYESIKSYKLTVRASNTEAGVPRITHPVPIVESRKRRSTNITDNMTGNFTGNATQSPTQSPTISSTAVARATSGVTDKPWALNSTVFVFIDVVDVNDNSPMFQQSQYVAGVPVNAELGVHVITVKATDRDSGNFSVIRYRLESASADTEDVNFHVDAATGEISTASASQFFEHAGSHFELRVIASDNPGGKPSRSGDASLTVYVLTESQQILMILGVPKENLVAKQDLFTQILSNITKFRINIDKIDAHKLDTQGYDLRSTDVFFHAVDPVTNKVVEREEVIRKLEDNLDLINELLRDFNVTVIRDPPNVAAAIKTEDSDLLYILIGVIALVTLILVIILVFVYCRRRKRRKYRKKMQTTLVGDGIIFGSPPSTLQLEPYDVEDDDNDNGKRNTITRENPIWVDPYDTWLEKSAAGSGVALIDDDRENEDEQEEDVTDGFFDRGNPLYESQEIKMDMFVDTSDVDTDDFEDGNGSQDNLLAAALDEPSNVSTTAI